MSAFVQPVAQGELHVLGYRTPAAPSGFYFCRRCEVKGVREMGEACWSCGDTDALVAP